MIEFKTWKFKNHFMIRAKNKITNKYYGFRVNRSYESDLDGNKRVKNALEQIVKREN